jgi:hypothetical protein
MTMTSTTKVIAINKTNKADQADKARQANIAISAGFMALSACLFYLLSSTSAFAQVTAHAPAVQNAAVQNAAQNQALDQKSEQPPESSAASNLPMTFERGGLDKASEHLQLLQQTSLHFVDTFQTRKPTSVDKKLQSKPQSNS